MDAISDKSTRKIVVMAPSQSAKTEIILNAIGYYAHLDACPMLWVLPNLDMAQTMSIDRIAPMVRDMSLPI